MKFNLFPHILLRTPQFSLDQSIKEIWPELKESIRYSSKTFYETIKEIDYEELSSLNHKEKYTIWKYFNRAKFRATPFGHFAAFSTLQFSTLSSQQPIIINRDMILHSFIDWPHKERIEFNYKIAKARERIVYANETIYLTADDIRYVFLNNANFEIGSICREDTLITIIDYCKNPVKRYSLSNFINKELMLANGEQLIEDLLELQLLYTDLTPNIIGQDYFDRIEMKDQKDLSKYLIAERKVCLGHLCEFHLRHLNDCISYLLQINTEIGNKDLQHFKTNFLRRFGEGVSVSLLDVLDPEIGIGYGHYAQIDSDIDIQMLKHSPEDPSTNIKWGEFELFLMEGILSSKVNIEHVIYLEQFVSKERIARSPANSFSTIFTIAGDMIILQAMGGTTANAVLGRFTLPEGKVREMCKSIVNLESEANPDVIFFDVGYCCENNFDNVNRRFSIYNFEMPVLVCSTSKNPIQVNDVQLSMNGNEIILHSNKLKKRLIPRLASAYNYKRSDLALYRFLCDVQADGVQSNLTIDISQKIPGLKYYPRVQYKNIVLSPAKWKVEIKIFDTNDILTSLKKLQVNSIFTCGHADQILYFNTTIPEDIAAFSSYLKQQKGDFYIEEAFCQNEKPIVVDIDGLHYNAQYLVSLYHTQELYKKIDIPLIQRNRLGEHDDIVYPGDNWVYFKIYCHPISTDKFLTCLISPFIDTLQIQIKKWFFVRYLDPEHHVRLRIQLEDKENGYELIRNFSKLIKSTYEEGRIQNFQIREYKREIGRYGADLINQIENHFCLSSVFAICILKKDYNDFQKYSIVYQLLLEIFNHLKFSKSSQIEFTRSHEEAFVKEHHWRSHTFSLLNKEYKKLMIQPAIVFTPEEADYKSNLLQSFTEVLESCQELRRKQLLSDLIHMLVNRLFRTDQRLHEAIIYYFLLKLIVKNSKYKQQN